MRSILIAALMIVLAGCASTGIAVREALGNPKREQLVERVQKARDDQQEAKEQFSSALDEFLALTSADTGDLEKTYERLKKELTRSESQAETVRDRIRDVERVAGALFKEWNAELKQYHSEDLRRSSQQQLDRTKERYEELLEAMKSAEARMQPVLDAFNDQVLFLKHNLNARAIASLDREVASVQSDVARLIDEMNASIEEANAFIADMAGE
ncbi:MAG: DUF2959 domain-containing protein [Leptolyngbya sp. PLA3]|nr:MAG: DUF2959 domain-containing protein [Cyanobacteria bacterium CYA]MCE7968442.1 DUF2959 domain-containing protein [Leptolyngbya sp. PL-A3]